MLAANGVPQANELRFRSEYVGPRRESRLPDLCGSPGFTSTKTPNLKFRALLTEGDAQLLFHREVFGQLGENCIA
jgi:hypothetical protein